jgi:hypothetical protein
MPPSPSQADAPVIGHRVDHLVRRSHASLQQTCWNMHCQVIDEASNGRQHASRDWIDEVHDVCAADHSGNTCSTRPARRAPDTTGSGIRAIPMPCVAASSRTRKSPETSRGRNTTWCASVFAFISVQRAPISCTSSMLAKVWQLVWSAGPSVSIQEGWTRDENPTRGAERSRH